MLTIWLYYDRSRNKIEEKSMGSLEIFSGLSNFMVSLTALGLLFFSCWYASRDSRISNCIWFLFLGFTLEFIAVWISYQTMELYNAGTTSVSFWVFLELLLLLGSMVCLAVSASQLVTKNMMDLPVILALGILGLISIIYFVFISPDGNVINTIRQIFPIAGLTYMSISFWSQMGQRYRGGYSFAALTSAFAAVVLVLRMLGFEGFGVDSWYLAPLVYVMLSIAILMIKNDRTYKKLDEIETEIENSNKRLEKIIRTSPFPIVISRLSDDRIILANNNAVKLFGIQPGELERYRLRDFFADADNRQLLNERLEAEREVQDFEILVKTPTGDTPFWLLASANIIDYNYDVALYSAFQDITTRKNRENLLKNQATRDPLTSLYNRRYFEEEVFKRILDSKVSGEAFSVLMLDVDHFKKVNDTFGHKVGDKVLIELAAAAERALRECDIVARYGGEEFVIFLADTNSEEGLRVAERLRETIGEVVVYTDDGREVRFTVSVGLSSSAISENIDMLIKTADEALYRAKNSGRNRVVVFTPEDLNNFNASAERKNEEANHHPIFDKENSVEISLLDGVESNHIQSSEKTEIEEPRITAGTVLPGVDEEDLR